MIRGAIFDVDGTLLDSMGIWEDAGARYLRRTGIEPEAGLGRILYPMTIGEAAAYLQERYALPAAVPAVAEGILDTVRSYYYQEAPLKAGARELLAAFADQEIPMAAATSSEETHIRAAFERLGIMEYFRGILTCTKAGAGKTSPKIYRMAAELLHTVPEETLVFEDALYALLTAKRAGFRTVGVYDGSQEEEQEQMKTEAEWYVRELSEFPAVFGHGGEARSSERRKDRIE